MQKRFGARCRCQGQWRPEVTSTVKRITMSKPLQRREVKHKTLSLAQLAPLCLPRYNCIGLGIQKTSCFWAHFWCPLRNIPPLNMPLFWHHSIESCKFAILFPASVFGRPARTCLDSASNIIKQFNPSIVNAGSKHPRHPRCLPWPFCGIFDARQKWLRASKVSRSISICKNHQNISKHIKMLRTRFLLNFDSDFQELWKATKALSYPVIVVVYRLVHACETSPEHNKIRPAIHFQVTCWRFSVEDRMGQHVQAFTERRNMFQNVSTCFGIVFDTANVQRQGSDKRFPLAVIALAALALPSLCPKVCILFVRVQGRVWRHVKLVMIHDHILTESSRS